ncbi:hypothetical protein Unana1_07281 [Umbelopsis nana]
MQLRIKQATKKKKSLKQLASGSSSEIVTHTLHWALCDYYLESVGLSPVFYLRSNSRNHQPASKVEKDEVHTNVQFAISTLQDLLVNETNLVVVLSTRLALAKLLIKYTTDWELADENLRMVLRKISSADRNHDRIGFEAITLRCQLLVKRGDPNSITGAVKMLTAATEQAKSFGRTSWTYEFYLRKIGITELNGRQEQCVEALREVIELARNQEHEEMQAVFLLLWTRFSIAWNKKNDVETGLQQLQSICTSNYNNATFQLITTQYHILYILFYTLSGNIRDAQDNAQKAEQFCNVMSDDITIKVVIPEGPNLSEVVKVHWMTKSGVQAVLNLIAGICYLQDATTPKAKDYFEKGISAILGDIQKQKDTILQSRSCTECNGSGQFLCLECYNQGHNRATMLLASVYVHLLEHLMYYHLSQCNYVEAHKTLTSMKEFCDTYDMTFGHSYTLQLSTAMYLQSIGEFSKARREYEQLLQEREIAQHPDKASVISFCLILMQPCEQQISGTQVSNLTQALTAYVEASAYQSDALKCILRVLQSLQGLETGTIVEVKRNILEALRTASALGNMQLKALVLTVLGLLFHVTQHEQSAKMLTSAYSLNQKTKNKYATRIIKEALEETLKRA